jgi:hypothetical protein
MIKRIYSILQKRGLAALFGVAYHHVARPRLARSFRNIEPLFRDRVGLEIGGPSDIFGRRGLFPVYPIARHIDNCNFGATTVWEGSITQGATFRYDKKHAPGTQYIAEATDLSFAVAESYNFILSSHTLEHIANPLRALSEWKRVLKDDGMLALVLPHRDGTFDHRRPVTSLSHLIDDFDQNTGEDDLTHLDEILMLHDLEKDPLAGDSETFKTRGLKNIENRCLHHHVFDSQLAAQIADRAGFQILALERQPPFHIIVIARKPGSDAVARNNDLYVSESTTHTWISMPISRQQIHNHKIR